MVIPELSRFYVGPKKAKQCWMKESNFPYLPPLPLEAVRPPPAKSFLPKIRSKTHLQ